MPVKDNINDLKLEIRKRINHFGDAHKNSLENDFNRRGQNDSH
jgi:hypothetical protein